MRQLLVSEMGDTHTVTDEAIRQACLAFGYTALSRKQEMAVRGFLSGKDVFVPYAQAQAHIKISRTKSMTSR